MRIAFCSNVLGAEPEKYASRCLSTVQPVQRPMPLCWHLVAELPAEVCSFVVPFGQGE
jgi:hypothetical protein